MIFRPRQPRDPILKRPTEGDIFTECADELPWDGPLERLHRMDGFSIPRWTLALVAGLIAVGMLLAAELAGLVWGLPALYVVPFMWRQFQFERAMRRELRSWLHG